MGKTYYKMKGGKQVKVSSREIKQYIMKAHGWTAEQYQKQYDLFKNKLRAYESFKASHGGKVQPQSVVDVLYAQAKSMKRRGEGYKPSLKMKQIESFSAYSITKGRKLAGTLDYQAREIRKYGEFVNMQFEGLLKANAKAREIAEAVADPIKREEALSAYANAIHAKTDEQGKVEEGEAVPYSGEAQGSPDAIDFDYTEYL